MRRCSGVDSTRVVDDHDDDDDDDDGGSDDDNFYHNHNCSFGCCVYDDTGPGRTQPAMALARGPDPRCF